MNAQIKSATSLITLALFGLAFLCDANAGSVRSKRHTSEQIQTCISEIGRNANYENASRVVHWIAALNQRNLVEMEIKIETSVSLKSDDVVAREYRTVCVTGTMGDLVDFRIDVVGTDLEMGGE